MIVQAMMIVVGDTVEGRCDGAGGYCAGDGSLAVEVAEPLRQQGRR